MEARREKDERGWGGMEGRKWRMGTRAHKIAYSHKRGNGVGVGGGGGCDVISVMCILRQS